MQASYIPLVHSRQGSSAEDINAMDSLRSILDNAGFPDGECFCFGFKYLNNETNRVSPLRQTNNFEHIIQVLIQRGGQGIWTPHGKSQVIWVSIGNKQLDPPWKKLDPLENVGPPPEP